MFFTILQGRIALGKYEGSIKIWLKVSLEKYNVHIRTGYK
jgi:hypothetical protein